MTDTTRRILGAMNTQALEEIYRLDRDDAVEVFRALDLDAYTIVRVLTEQTSREDVLQVVQDIFEEAGASVEETLARWKRNSEECEGAD